MAHSDSIIWAKLKNLCNFIYRTCRKVLKFVTAYLGDIKEHEKRNVAYKKQLF